MAETLISPGVLARENDSSFVARQPIAAGAAIIGPTVKGPVNIPTLVTTYSDFQNKFGAVLLSGSNTYTYFTSIAAYNYFNNGGNTLLVTRVVNGNFTPATSSNITNDLIVGGVSQSAFVLETLSEGTIMNNNDPQDLYGALPSGSADNIRWQVLNSDINQGTFDLLIRRGDDITDDLTVLETWVGLSLDPLQDNYISKVIGDQKESYNPTNIQVELSGFYANASNYVRVKQVNWRTPNYFTNAGAPKTEFTGSLPLDASGSFGSALGSVMAGANFYNTIDGSNTQGLVETDYDDMIDLLSNQDDYLFNIMLTPGLMNTVHAGQMSSIISNTQQRGDSIYVADMVPFGSTLTSVVAQAASRNTSYAATYWPWVLVFDPDTGDMVWVPASTVIGGVYSYNDTISEPWFAPAGINRGGLGQVVRAEQKLPQSSRDVLYNGKVNPIATFPSTGVVVYGQKTLQTKASALDRVNVRRLLIALKGYISQVAQNLVFEQNTAATRNSFLAVVNPYLESVQQRQGLYAFKVVMDDTNNTADVVDRNQLIGQIYLQPTKTAEFIYLDFNLTPTGAVFPA